MYTGWSRLPSVRVFYLFCIRPLLSILHLPILLQPFSIMHRRLPLPLTSAVAQLEVFSKIYLVIVATRPPSPFPPPLVRRLFQYPFAWRRPSGQSHPFRLLCVCVLSPQALTPSYVFLSRVLLFILPSFRSLQLGPTSNATQAQRR